MNKHDLVPRKRYAVQNWDKATVAEEPLVKVTWLGRIDQREVLVRFETGPRAGLERWLTTRDLICPWKEHRAYLKDQERYARLRQTNKKSYDWVIEGAICCVMEASGEETGFQRTWTTDPATARRLWARARLPGSPLDHRDANYEDRFGAWHLSFETALAACAAFAAAEPDLVELHLRGREERMKAEGFLPGRRTWHQMLREYAPSHAVARGWTQKPRGHAAEKEVERLQGLVQHAIETLRLFGHEEAAQDLEFGLRGQ